MPVPTTTVTTGYQQAVRERLARSHRHLLAGVLADTLAQATAALTAALADDHAPVEVLRVAANHTSTLLRLLHDASSGHRRPLPEQTLAVAHALRAWAVTARTDHPFPSLQPGTTRVGGKVEPPAGSSGPPADAAAATAPLPPTTTPPTTLAGRTHP